MAVAKYRLFGFQRFDAADVEFDFVDLRRIAGHFHQVDDDAVAERFAHLAEIGDETASAHGEFGGGSGAVLDGGRFSGLRDNDGMIAGLADGRFPA